MRRTIVLVVVGLAAGVTASLLIVANPYGWGWVSRLTAPILPAHVIQPASEGRVGGQRQIRYWRAPMDPTYISDEPGKSPMGMDLIPVYEDDPDGLPPGAIHIDPTFVQNIGVQSEEVRRTSIPHTIRTIGTLTYNDAQVAWVNTKYEGWIEKAYVNYVGQPVRRGQKLFEIYSPQLVSTQEEYLQAVDYAERMAAAPYPEIAARARSLVGSARQRLAYWDISDDQIAELEASRVPSRTLAVSSPAGGLVEKMNQALEGMYVKPGMNLYQIVNLSTIWVEAEVFESQAPWVRAGQQAIIELPYEPGSRHVGTVRYLHPSFDSRTRTLKLSIELPNPGQKLRAEMYASVTLDVPSAENVLAIGEEAVIHSGRRNIVVLDSGGGTFQVREVELGANANGLWEVRKGLREGERVVVSAQFLIDSESNLQEAIRKLTSGSQPAREPGVSGPGAPPPAAAPTGEHAGHEG